MARIGVIDSGYGGLSVLRAYTHQRTSKHTIIYAGDNARAPYGVKTVEMLYTFSIEMIDYLIETHQVEVVILACGTLATNVLPQLQAHYPSLPIYGISQQIFTQERDWKHTVGVIATKKTVESQYFQHAFQQYDVNATVISTQVFVEMVEGRTDADMSVIQQALLSVKQCQMLILGCTHFPFLAKQIQQCLPNTQLLDPADALLSVIDGLDEDDESTFTYITSGDVKQFAQFLTMNKLPQGEIIYENFTRFK